MKTDKQVADDALRAAGLLAAFLLGNGVIQSEAHLDDMFDAVIDLLERTRNERHRLRGIWVPPGQD